MLHSIWLQILGGIPMVPDASLCYDKSRTEKKEVPSVSRPPMDPARFRQEMVPQFLTALLLVFPLYNGLLWPLLFESSYTGMVLYDDSASRDAVRRMLWCLTLWYPGYLWAFYHRGSKASPVFPASFYLLMSPLPVAALLAVLSGALGLSFGLTAAVGLPLLLGFGTGLAAVVRSGFLGKSPLHTRLAAAACAVWLAAGLSAVQLERAALPPLSAAPEQASSFAEGLTPEQAVEILLQDAYNPAFRRELLQTLEEDPAFFGPEYNATLIGLAIDPATPQEVRTPAAQALDIGDIGAPAFFYRMIYEANPAPEEKAWLLKQIGFQDPALARELSLDVLDNYEAYESRIVTMANKAYIRSIEGEQDLIDDIVARNREMMSAGDADLTDGCVLALAELKEPEAVELIFELDSFDGVSGVYKLVDYNFDGVVAYTAEAGPDSLAKIVEAVPVEEFIPIIEERRADGSLPDALAGELLTRIAAANREE